MSAFRKIGPAIGSLSAAISPAGGVGSQLGDVRLFPPDVDPGAGWLSTAAADAIPFNPRLDGFTDYTIRTSSQKPLNSETRAIRRIVQGNGLTVFGITDTTQAYIDRNDGNGPFQSVTLPANLVDIAFGNGVFLLALSGSNAVYSTTDFVTFTKLNIATATFVSVAFGGGIWVCGAASMRVFRSADLQAWSQISITGSSTRSAYVRYLSSQSKFIAWDNDSTALAALYVSLNGSSWAQVTVPTFGAVSDVADGGGRVVLTCSAQGAGTTATLVATGTIESSSSWNAVGSRNSVADSVVFGRGVFLMSDRVSPFRLYALLKESSAWVEFPSLLPSGMYSSIFLNDRFLLGCRNAELVDIPIHHRGITAAPPFGKPNHRAYTRIAS